jgi:hypothetical protein
MDNLEWANGESSKLRHLYRCIFVPLCLWPYLKKQSQFLKGQNDVKSILTMVYGDFNGLRQRKNKPNSKPIKANRRALVEISKQAE